MTDRQAPTDYASRDSSRWLWLSAFATIALIAISNDRLLLASGMLLLGVFAYFNNPLSPTASHIAMPRPALAVSWACGVMGVLAILVAAMKTWL